MPGAPLSPPAPEPHLISDGPDNASVRFILAHGAGAGMDTPWMMAFAGELSRQGIQVVRFEFPYMRRRRAEGNRRPPDRMAVLEASFRNRIEDLRQPGQRLIIGGKSMGGRVASHIADDARVDGLVCLGYPFHPPGKPDRLRTSHLRDLRTPTLILQGERDPFGTPEEVSGYPLSDHIRVEWLVDGDHGFKPRVRSGETLEANMTRATMAVARFASSLGG